MGIAELYTDELRAKYNYLAIWYPTIKLALGDIGYFNNQRIFVPAGKIDDPAVDLAPIRSPAAADFSHHSAHDFEYDVKLKGKANSFTPHLPEAAAGVGMHFGREGAMFFQLDEVTHERIGNQIALGRKLLELAKRGEWERDWLVVTEVMRARKFVVLVSEAGGGKAELTADADFSALGLKALTAGGSASLVHSHALDTQITTPAGSPELTPLFRAVRVKRKFFVGPRTVAPAYASEIDEHIAAPAPDPLDVLEELTSYPDESGA